MTKYVLMIALFWTLISWRSQARTEEDYQREASQVALWEGKLSEAKALPENERVQNLWLGLRNMGHRRNSREHGGGVDVIFRDIQNELLAIPGHAQWIADEVERLRKESQHLRRENQSSYDLHRQTLLDDTLKHLPSPETVKVLGHYLNDERDPPPEPLFLPENAFLACMALSEIGLRDVPVKSRPGYASWKDAAAKQRAWYAQVKAGTIPFSFVGQKVEYRFKPDGTWDTIALYNPPNDGPIRKIEEKPAPVRPSRRSKVDSDSSDKSENGSPWLWVIGIPVLLLAGTLWLLFRNSAK